MPTVLKDGFIPVLTSRCFACVNAGLSYILREVALRMSQPHAKAVDDAIRAAPYCVRTLLCMCVCVVLRTWHNACRVVGERKAFKHVVEAKAVQRYDSGNRDLSIPRAVIGTNASVVSRFRPVYTDERDDRRNYKRE